MGTDTADAEFERVLALEEQRKLDSQNSKQRKQEDEILHSTATRTTAEPRVNAYIPDGEYGLPKAHGSHAPFMPTTLGSTMRHIKNQIPSRSRSDEQSLLSMGRVCSGTAFCHFRVLTHCLLIDCIACLSKTCRRHCVL